MKCVDCEACHKEKITRYPVGNGQPSVEVRYMCWGVKEPFEIIDINHECTEYPERAARSVGCEYCNDRYDQKITCYNARNHSNGDTHIKQIDVNFCPNCGRKLIKNDTE